MSQDPAGQSRESLFELATLAGVSTEYYDIKGELCRPSIRAIKSILAAMGYADVELSLSMLRLRPFDRLLEPVHAVFEDEQPVNITLRIPCPDEMEQNAGVSVTIRDEDGSELEARTINGVVPSGVEIREERRFITVDIMLDIPRQCGYYQVDAKVSTPLENLSGRMLLIIAPRSCHMPSRRTWGITLSLYGVRSSKNWGMGDLGDLKYIIKAAGELGAGFVGINPLHATPGRLSLGVSPYQPLSRLYMSCLYSDASTLPPQDRLSLGECRASALVDYDRVASLKLRALRNEFERFRAKGSRQFDEYCLVQGQALEDYATYMALANYMEETGLTREPSQGWFGWPAEYQDPRSPEVEAFKEVHANKVLFHKYIQWKLDRQLADAVSAGGGMDLGLYADLAVGSSAGGSDAWSYRGVFAESMNMGAPPDDFSPFGQNWLFPPLVPGRLRDSGYSLFISTLRQSMRHAGALRIDHALGLFRAFWIPEGMGADEGTYVTYPHEDLLKIISLESSRSRTVVIAEDLGTMGTGVREALQAHGMLSYRLLYFSRDWERGSFRPPGEYPRAALSAINTHDLPTLRGFWEASDIKERDTLGLYPDSSALEAAMQQREQEKDALIEALAPYMPDRDNGIGPSGHVSIAAHRFISMTPSLMTAMSLDDALDIAVQQNLPGVEKGHPNWRRKYTLEIGDIFGPGNRAPLLGLLVDIFRESRSLRPL